MGVAAVKVLIRGIAGRMTGRIRTSNIGRCLPSCSAHPPFDGAAARRPVSPATATMRVEVPGCDRLRSWLTHRDRAAPVFVAVLAVRLMVCRFHVLNCEESTSRQSQAEVWLTSGFLRTWRCPLRGGRRGHLGGRDYFTVMVLAEVTGDLPTSLAAVIVTVYFLPGVRPSMVHCRPVVVQVWPLSRVTV